MFDWRLDKLCVMDKAKFNQALYQGACDVVNTMLSQGYIPNPNCIQVVCENGNLTLLQMLLSAKCDMNVQLGFITAVKYKQTHLLDYLYLAGADINLSDVNGNAPLYYVEDVETCKWLLDKGAQQMSNLLDACCERAYCSRYVDIAKLLLSHDEEQLTLFYSDGKTPLHSLCTNDFNIEMIKLILSYKQGEQGISMKDQNGKTCLHKAHNAITMGVLKLLLSYEQGVQSILVTNNYGQTPLYRVCEYGNPYAVSLLLSHEQGVQSILIKDNHGSTPLHMACGFRGNAEIVQRLLMHQAGVQSILMCDSLGNTPLHVACCSGYFNADVFKLLLSHEQGVQSISVKNNSGSTPMDNARDNAMGNVRANAMGNVRANAGIYPEMLTLLQNAID